MVTHVDQISTPPTPADSPSIFEERAAQVWSDLARNVPQMNQQADEIEAIGQAADTAMRSAQADSDAAMGYRNEAKAASSSAQSAAASAGAGKDGAEDAKRVAEEAADRALTAAADAENRVPMTAATGVALLPEGTDSQRPAAGSIPAGVLVMRGNSQDPADYKPEFWDRVAGVWRTFASRQQQWFGIPVGMPFSLHTDAPKPPTNQAGLRYIELTAGLTGAGGYNNGVLTSETVTGSSPSIVASAVVSLAASPLNGKIVRLINTTREFMRPGISSSVPQSSQNQAHSHPIPDLRSSGSGFATPPNNAAPIVVTTMSSGDSGGDESRPRNYPFTYFMRIL